MRVGAGGAISVHDISGNELIHIIGDIEMKPTKNKMKSRETRAGALRVSAAAVVLFLLLLSRPYSARAAVSITQLPGFIDYTTLVYILEVSDSYYWIHNVPNNLSNYDENEYSEFSNFGFTMTSGQSITLAEVRVRWCYNDGGAGNAPDGVKLEVWEQDTGTWHSETGITILTTGCTTTRTRDVLGYINTYTDINNIKVRVLAYESSGTAINVQLNQMRVRARINGTTTTRNTAYAVSTNAMSIRTSDDVRLAYAADILTTLYNESVYQEYRDFGFDLPAGAELGSCIITYEWVWARVSGTANLTNAKLEVWDNSASTLRDYTFASIPARGTETTSTFDVTTYINTTDDINNIRFRFLGRASAASSVGIQQDYIKIVAKRKIVASDVAIYAPETRDFYPGTTNQIFLSFKVPDNDGAADTLTAFYVKNLGTAVNGSDITNLRVCKDNSPYGTYGTEDACSALTWSGANSWWSATGLSHAIPIGGMRAFVLGDITANPTDGRTIQMSIPLTASKNGLTVSSGYNGPTDMAVTNTFTQTINGMVASQITNTGAAASTPLPGTTNVLAMDFTIPLNGGAADTLTGLRVKNSGTAVNSTDISAVKAWAESGATAGFQAAQDTLLGTLAWSSGNSWWAITGLSLNYTTAKRIYITVDIAGSPTDGSTVQLYLVSGGTDSDAGVVVSSGNDGPLDAAVTNANTQTIDGMIASEITNTGAPAATIYANDTNVLAMNFVVPANGATADTLTGLRVQNAGTVASGQITAVKFWADVDGDGAFEPATDDAPALGTATWNAGGWWENTSLSQSIPTAGKRIFVSFDLGASPTVLGTVIMRIKTGSLDLDAGVVVASGNDGPKDAVVTNPNTLTVKKKLTVTGVSKVPLSVEPSSVNNTIEQLQAVSGQGTITISSMAILLTGTAVDSDIAGAKLWHDVNNDGMWDAGDVQLSTTKTFSSKNLTFNSISFPVTAGTPESLIITYDVAASPVNGHTAGVSLEARFTDAAVPAETTIVFNPDPIQSGYTLIGRTLYVSGTDKAPVGVDQGFAYVMEQITLTASSGTITANSIKVDLSGSGAAADITDASLYHDINDNGAYDSGTDILLDTKTFSGGPPPALTFSINFPVVYGTPENLLISYTIASGAVSGHTIGVSIPSTTYITTTASENINFTNTIQSTNSAINPSLLVAGTDKAPAQMGPGQTNVVMLSLNLQSTSGTITVTAIKAALTGTAPSNALASVKLYHDVNDNGAYESGTDVELSSKTFSSGVLTFNGLTFGVTAGTPENLLIVYNVSVAAATGNTAGVSLVDKTYVTVTAPSVVSAFSTIQSTNSLIATTLNVTGTDSAAGLTNNVTKGQQNVVFERLAMSTTYATIAITGLKIDLIGTGSGADISAARFFRDANNNGTFESGIDAQLGADKTFSGGTLTFDGFSQSLNTTTMNFLIMYYISGTATQGKTVGVRIADATYVTTNPTSGVTVNLAAVPTQSTAVTIMNPATLTASFPAITTPVNNNQTFTVKLTVTNAAGSSKSNATAPDPAALTKTYGGGAAVSLVSGPTPASAAIDGGGSQEFTYSFQATAAGTVYFTAAGKGTDVNLGTTVTSASANSNTVTINAQVSPAWMFSDGGAAQAFYGSGAPATNPNNVKVMYIGNENGKLYSINIATGAKLWAYTASAAIRSTPYVRNYVIYFGDESGNYYAVQDNGGSYTELWKKTGLGGGAIRTGTLRWVNGTEGRLYFGSLNNRVFCVKSSDGSTCASWTNPNVGSAVYSTPALPGDGYVYVGTYGGSIAKIDRLTGSVSSNYTGYTRITAAPFVYPKDPAVPANGSWLWIGSQNKYTYKIDTTKAVGSEKVWTFGPSTPIPVDIIQNSVFVDVWRGGAWGDKTVYVGNNNGCLYAITDTGAQKWKYPSGSDSLSNPISSCPMLDPNTNKIFFGAEDGKIYALLDGATAPTLISGWPYQTAGAIKACPSMYGNYVMFPSTDGKVYAFPR